jgi:hypothetical protein
VPTKRVAAARATAVLAAPRGPGIIVQNVSEAFPVREPDGKIDMIARSVGIVFALSVLLFLQPFSAQGQTPTPERKPFTPTPVNACAMLASDMTTPVSDGREKEWVRFCSLADVEDCQATIDYVQSEAHTSIPGLTCHGPRPAD